MKACHSFRHGRHREVMRLLNDELIYGRPDMQDLALLFRASMLILSGQIGFAEDDLKRILMKQKISNNVRK